MEAQPCFNQMYSESVQQLLKRPTSDFFFGHFALSVLMIAQFGFMSLSSVWHRLIPATLHNKHTARVCGFFNVFYMFCANKLAFFYFTCRSSAPYFVVNWWRQNCWTQRLFLILLVSLVDVPDYKSLFIISTRGQQSSTASCQTNCVLGDLFISRVL